MIKLSNKNLPLLPQEIRRPSYDRQGLRPGMVHIGLGNFHRAHQSWYLHRLLEQGAHHDWAIMGAGLRPYDAQQRQKLLDQDCLTTLIELDPSGRSAEVVGSMIGYVEVQKSNASLIAQMADPAIRIVSLTVTEGGYYLDPASRQFDLVHPDIEHDITNSDQPVTGFGAIIAALRIRRDQGHGPFTCMSCDNLQGNGDIVRQVIVALARQIDKDLAQWIDQEVSFPNSMVDCIVPATGESERALVREMGIEDSAPVTHENFRQWVIEDNFCAGRPNWDQVGATFSTQVHAYETMKIRILNGGHQILANAGELLGLETISNAMDHPLLQAFFRKVQQNEITPTVAPVPEMTPEAYCALIERRFANPAIVDTTRRVAFDGASRHSGFILPVLRDNLAQGRDIEGLALAEALWARMCYGSREDGRTIAANDPQWGLLQQAAKIAKETPSRWLEQRIIYGDIAQNSKFQIAFCRWLEILWTSGTTKALALYAGQPHG